MKRPLYFMKPCKPFNSGEVAGFNERDAARLIAMGVAMDYEEYLESIKPKPKEEKAPPKKAAPPKRAVPKKKAVKRSSKK